MPISTSSPATTDGRRDDARPTRGSNAPQGRPLPADIASLLAGWETSHAARDRAEAAHDAAAEMARQAAALARSMALIRDAAAAWAAGTDAATARVLDRIGPQVVGGWRYEGGEVDGLWGVVRTRVGGDARPIVAEACTAIDEETS